MLEIEALTVLQRTKLSIARTRKDQGTVSK
jgi:hypothetical protein